MTIVSDYIYYEPGTGTAYDLRQVTTYRQDERNTTYGWVRLKATNLPEVRVTWADFNTAINQLITRVQGSSQFVADSAPFHVTIEGAPGTYQDYDVVED